MRILKVLFLIYLLIFSNLSISASKAELDAEIKVALDELYKHSAVAKELTKKAKGILVFPNILKAGFIVGASYGEGALIINNKKVQYYNNIGGSVGYQIGAEKRSMVYLFLEDTALANFKSSDGWNGGGDASIAVAVWGAGGEITTESIKDPVIAFVYSPKGLMLNLTLEGSKITKIDSPK